MLQYKYLYIINKKLQENLHDMIMKQQKNTRARFYYFMSNLFTKDMSVNIPIASFKTILYEFLLTIVRILLLLPQ